MSSVWDCDICVGDVLDLTLSYLSCSSFLFRSLSRLLLFCFCSVFLYFSHSFSSLLLLLFPFHFHVPPQRVRPIIIELERQRQNMVVVCHLAVLRCIYAYFMGVELAHIPFQVLRGWYT